MKSLRTLMGVCGIISAILAAYVAFNNSTVASATQALAFAVTSIAFFKASDFFNS